VTPREMRERARRSGRHREIALDWSGARKYVRGRGSRAPPAPRDVMARSSPGSP